MEITARLSDDDKREIEAIVNRAIAAALQKPAADSEALIPEPRAAAELGVEPHVLRDARGKRQIEYFRVGRFVRYSREQIETFKQRCLQGGGE